MHKDQSCSVAKDRLSNVLLADRLNFKPEMVELMKQEILSVMEKYLEIAAVTRPNPENVAKYAKLKPIFEKIYEGLYDVYPDIYDAKKWLTGEDA